MLLRTLAALLSGLVLCAAQAPAGEFEAQFEAASKDPAQVVPLLFEVSAALPKVPAAEGQALAERLEPFARRAFFSPERLPGMERLGLVLHRVQPRELPSAVAKRYRVDAGLLALLNGGYDERRLGVGQELKVLDLSKGGLQVIVDRARHRLSLWRQVEGGEWVLALYVPVGLGAAETPTPAGASKVVQRERDPPWHDPVTKQDYPHGDPRNVLGGYWIELDCAPFGARTGIGLHGYTGGPEAEWLGLDASNGCVRMRPTDVACLFEVALLGTPVLISP